MARKKSIGLTPSEERFVEEYLIDRNGTAAYIRANPGTRRTTAGELSSRLLKKVKVKDAIAKASQELRRACKTSAVKEVKGLALLANYDIGAAFDLTADEWVPLPPRQIPYETRQAIVGVKVRRRRIVGDDEAPAVVETVEFRFADKLAARDKLMRHLGLYKDLPPLEVLLAALPPEVAEAVRAGLAAAVQRRGDPGRGPAPGIPLPGGDRLRPDGADAAGGADPRPVAGGVDPQPGPEAGGPLHPPVGEDPDDRVPAGGPVLD